MILHVDMDAFYASVEQRDRPELRGKPVLVGGSAESRGVVCAASYEARKFGARSAMPTATAMRLCPQAILLPIRMGYYSSISRQIREIFLSFTPLVEPLSLDEAYLDVHGCEPLFGPPLEIARKLKARVRAETQLIASVGVAANKFLAKLASDFSKPDGLLNIEPDKATDFLKTLPVGRIWGVGAKGEKRLHELGIRTIGELAAIPEAWIVRHLGDGGREIWKLANGSDDRKVVPDREAKSVSTETTFAQDIGDRQVLRSRLLELVDELGRRLRHAEVKARTVELKVRSSDFRTFTRSMTLSEPTDVTDSLWNAAKELMDRRVPDDLLPLRLLGVGGTGLVREGGVQGNLFGEMQDGKPRALDQALDEIRSRYGIDAVKRGGTMDRPHGRKPEKEQDRGPSH
jgi:DNA polymerase-4